MQKTHSSEFKNLFLSITLYLVLFLKVSDISVKDKVSALIPTKKYFPNLRIQAKVDKQFNLHLNDCILGCFNIGY